MSFIEIVLLAVGLSMDSLAVSVAGGALIQNYKHHHMLKIGCVMGGFQAGMTIAGYLAGLSFKKYITAFDHWIAFLLLLYLGGKMIYESTKEEEKNCKTNPLCYKTLCGLGIATSIDALGSRHIARLHRNRHCTGSPDNRNRHILVLSIRSLLRKPLQPQDRSQIRPGSVA